METRGPINPPSENKSYIHVIVDAFSHFVVSVPIKSNNAKTAVTSLLHHLDIKFGPPMNLVTDRGLEYINIYWHNSVPSWEFVTLLEPLTHLGQMNSVKYKTKTLVQISVCFLTTLQKTGLINSICTPMHIIQNLFHR